MMYFTRSTLRWYSAPVVEHTEALPEGWTAHRSGEEDFPWEEWPAPEHRERYRTRFALGHEVVVVRVSGGLAHATWVARRRLAIDELCVTWELPGDTLCLYDVVTLPAFRGRGLYHHVLANARSLTGSTASTRIWIYADSRNVASLSAIEKAGYQYRQSAGRASVGPLTVFRHGSIPEAR